MRPPKFEPSSVVLNVCVCTIWWGRWDLHPLVSVRFSLQTHRSIFRFNIAHVTDTNRYSIRTWDISLWENIANKFSSPSEPVVAASWCQLAIFVGPFSARCHATPFNSADHQQSTHENTKDNQNISPPIRRKTLIEHIGQSANSETDRHARQS